MDWTYDTIISLGSALVAGGTLVYTIWRNHVQDRVNTEIRTQQADLERKYSQIAEYELKRHKDYEQQVEEERLKALEAEFDVQVEHAQELDLLAKRVDTLVIKYKNVGKHTANGVGFALMSSHELIKDGSLEVPHSNMKSDGVAAEVIVKLDESNPKLSFALYWTDGREQFMENKFHFDTSETPVKCLNGY